MLKLVKTSLQLSYTQLLTSDALDASVSSRSWQGITALAGDDKNFRQVVFSVPLTCQMFM